MSITLYTASVPVFVRMLGNLSNWLEKAEAHAEARTFDPQVLMTARLAPDMLPLSKQVQIACDTAKFCAARLAGVESPVFEDSEATLAELRARTAKTIDWVRSVPAESIAGSEDRDVTVPRRGGAITMKGRAYLEGFALPNFYFHATTTYALLRHNGVPLGKMDFLGALQG